MTVWTGCPIRFVPMPALRGMHPVRALLAAMLMTLAAVLLTLAAATTARGHGDSSTHYLETQSLYPAFTNQASQAMELELLGLLDAASRRGYPVKVVMLGSENDVPDTPAMVRAPQRYAQAVESELEGVRTLEAPLLVVTPYGLGVAGPAMRGPRFGPLSRADARALVRGIRLSRHADGDELARAAMTAVRRIARSGGHPLPANVPPAKLPVPPLYERPGDGSGAWLPIGVFVVIFGGAVVLYEVLVRISHRRRRPPAAADIALVRETSERA